MKLHFKIVFLGLLLTLFGCSSDNQVVNSDGNPIEIPSPINYLALGDSYTIGQSVCETCRFPIQLQDSLKKYFPSNKTVSTKIIATTGWTTTNLKNAIASQNPANNYDFVSLLIGVNNQYQNKPFSLYEQEFPELVNIAITKAKGIKANVIVVSIPDYAYTHITDITRLGLFQPNLVANDGLHPSEIAYTKFVERILPKVKLILGL
jgi:acyl-CoA thioesterase-1